MSFNVDFNISDIIDLEGGFDKMADGFEGHIVDMLNIIGWQIHADSVEMILRGPTRHGKKYKKNGRLSVRSAWGEPAKVDTGNLQSSLDVQLQGSKAVKIGYLQNIAPYGEDLEDPAKLNRPVLVTAQAQNITFIRAQIKRTIQKIVKI
jgi:hypothetical protein